MDSEAENRITVLLFKAVRSELGRLNNLQWRQFKHDWLKSQNWPDYCYKCSRRVYKNRHGSNSRTLDHIIPASMIEELELFELWYEPLNFTLLCEACNTNKSNKLPSMTDLEPALLAKFYWALDEKNRRLALAR